MKKILIAMLAIAGVLFATSCGNDDDDTMVTLSEKSLKFTTTGGEKTIAVTADEEWTAAGTDWIETTKNGENLIVKVRPNNTIYPREGAVTVNAGSAVALLKVTQEGLKGNATITPDKLDIQDKAGKVVIEILANDENWTAVSDVPWLTVTAKPQKAELLVEYAKNEEDDIRKGVITVTVGDVDKVINVTQEARFFYILPYTDLKGGTVELVQKFEENRGGTPDADFWQPAMGYVGYLTRSEMFPKARYIITQDKGIKLAGMLAKDAKTMKANLSEFTEFLEKSGFKKISDAEFYNEKLSIKAEISIDEARDTAIVLYKFYKPAGDQPTFKQFPYPYMEWGVKKDKIDTYEADKGNTVNEQFTRIGGTNQNTGKPYTYDFLAFDADAKDEAQTSMHLYVVEHDDQEAPGLSESALLMKNTELAFEKDNDEAVLTKEFKELCKKEGFEYIKAAQGFFFFKNEAKKVVLMIGRPDYGGEIGQVIHMIIYKASEEAAAYNYTTNFAEKFKSAKTTYTVEDLMK